MDSAPEAVALRGTFPRDSLGPLSAEHLDGIGNGGGGGGEDEASQRGEGAGRLEYFLCDVGSTNGTYVQVAPLYLLFRSGLGLHESTWKKQVTRMHVCGQMNIAPFCVLPRV